MRFSSGGAFKEVSGGSVRIAGAWKQLVKARVFVGGAWREAATFIQPLSATASPASVQGGRVGSGNVTTAQTTVTPTGGQPPYTYAWTRTLGAGNITTPTSSATRFTQLLDNGQELTGTFRCTVTDNLGASVTADVSATFTSNDGDLSIM